MQESERAFKKSGARHLNLRKRKIEREREREHYSIELNGNGIELDWIELN